MSSPVELVKVTATPPYAVAVARLSLPLSPSPLALLERCSSYTRLTPSSLKTAAETPANQNITPSPPKITRIGSTYVPEAITQSLDIHIRRINYEQNNVDAIVLQALAIVKEDAQPQAIEEEWLHNFFDKCRLASNTETQKLWAKLLASEAATPGKYTKQTVALLQQLGLEEVRLVETICRFCVTLEFCGEEINLPLLLDVHNKFGIYYRNGISLEPLQNLQSLGLIQLKSGASTDQFFQIISGAKGRLHYFSENFAFQFSNKTNTIIENRLDLGQVLWTAQGQKIASLFEATPLQEFGGYLIRQMHREGEFNIYRTR